MNRKLTYNYWLMIVAWCMFLNGYNLLANMFGIAACAVLSTMSKRINYWRMCFVTLIIFVTISLLLINSNISYFFPKLYYFLAFICLDMALTNEHLYLFKSKYLKPFLIVIAIDLVVLSLIVLVLPADLYSLFTKKSLFLMICLIFLPYLISIAICIASKQIRYKQHSNVLVKA